MVWQKAKRIKSGDVVTIRATGEQVTALCDAVPHLDPSTRNLRVAVKARLADGRERHVMNQELAG